MDGNTVIAVMAVSFFGLLCLVAIAEIFKLYFDYKLKMKEKEEK